MRDPGPPRRNPFFEHGSEGAADGAVGGFAALFALAEALGDAQPEVAEHLVAAAHEVVLTVKVLVDATEAVLAEQRAALADRNRADAERAPDTAPVTDLAAVRRAEGP